MSKINVVCIPFHDIKLAQVEGFRTRDAHLYRFFAKHESVSTVVIFNRPTMLPELLLKRKQLKTKGELVYAKKGIYITRLQPGLFAVDILDRSPLQPILKGKRYIPELYIRNKERFQKALSVLDVKDYITYESSPLTVPFCNELTPQQRIFDGVDNLCKHSTYAALHGRLETIYRHVIDTYPFVYFNSQDSVKYFSVQALEKVEFLPNGVDFSIFRQSYDRPTLMANLPRPLVVYAGKMQEMLDVELIQHCAQRLPQATFLLLGKVLSGEIKAKLSSAPNVMFGGDIRYDDLPAYITHADVCFIPYRVDKQHGGDPIKFYEYMAANKKTLSTAIGEIEKYHDGVATVVCAREVFVDQLEVLLATDRAIDNVLPESMTWEYKADYMLKKAGAL